jgi:hypothetical protein
MRLGQIVHHQGKSKCHIFSCVHGEQWFCGQSPVVPGQDWHGPHKGCPTHVHTRETIIAGDVC